MSIKKSFDAVIEKYGNEIIYARGNHLFQCSCFIERTGESDPKCKECLGTGHPVKLEKLTVRRATELGVTKQAESDAHYKAGTQISSQFEYYLQSEHLPKEGDLILEVEFNQLNKVARVLFVSYIAKVLEMRGPNGDIQFYQVYCRFKGRNKENDKAISDNYL